MAFHRLPSLARRVDVFIENPSHFAVRNFKKRQRGPAESIAGASGAYRDDGLSMVKLFPRSD